MKQWLRSLFVLAPSVALVRSTSSVDCDQDPESALAQGVHLAYAGSTGHNMAISFFSCGTNGTAQAYLLDDENSPKRTVNGTTSRYYKRHHHDVILSGLTPGTTYRYAVGLTGGKRSPAFTFRTADTDGKDSERFTAAIIGDMGVNNSAATIARLSKLSSFINFTIHLGDVGYADDHNLPLHIEPPSGRSYEAVYDLFQRLVEPIASSAPYMVLPGNHDVSCSAVTDIGCPQEQQNFSAIRHRFRMPSIESGSSQGPHHNMWYSWKVGSVHFVSLSSETDFPNAPTTPHTGIVGGAGGGFGDQLGWLQQDLARARADPTVKWIVAMGHRPWYASLKHDWPLLAPRHVQHAFEPVLHKYGVDLWLCGHKHYYERTKPAFAGKIDTSRGVVQIINGAAGNNEGMHKGHGNGGLIAASNYADNGYGELSVLDATSLRWRYVKSSDGTLLDELILPARKLEDTEQVLVA